MASLRIRHFRLERDHSAGRNFIIMGFNYERGVGEMLEDYGHRTESIMSHVYGGWDHRAPKTNWDRFTLYENVAPGKTACGNVHYAPITGGGSSTLRTHRG